MAEETCCVCLELTHCITSCGHVLCDHCDRQLRRRRCPLCRASLPGDEAQTPWDGFAAPAVVWPTEYPDDEPNGPSIRLQRQVIADLFSTASSPCPPNRGGPSSRVGSYLARAAGAMKQPSRVSTAARAAAQILRRSPA